MIQRYFYTISTLSIIALFFQFSGLDNLPWHAEGLSVPEIVDKIKVGHGPQDMDLNIQTKKIYVANSGSNYISVINATNNRVINNVTGLLDFVEPIAIDQNTNTIYATERRAHSIAVINGTSDTIIRHIPINPEEFPFALAVDERNNVLYIGNMNSKNIYVINASTDQIIKNFTFGGFGGVYADIEVNPVSGKVYIPDIRNDRILVLNTSNHEKLYDIDVARQPFDISIDIASNTIYVLNKDGNRISVIDGYIDKVKRTIIPSIDIQINIFNNPRIEVDSDSARIYVTAPALSDDGIDNSYILDLANDRTITRLFPTLHLTSSLINPILHDVYLTDYNSDQIIVINATANYDPIGPTENYSISPPISLKDGLKIGTENTRISYDDEVIVNPLTNKVYVSHSDGVSVIDETRDYNVKNILMNGTTSLVSLDIKTNTLIVANEFWPNQTIFMIDADKDIIYDNVSIGNKVYNQILYSPTEKSILLNEFNTSRIDILSLIDKQIISNRTLFCISCLYPQNDYLNLRGIGNMMIDPSLGILYSDELGTSKYLHLSTRVNDSVLVMPYDTALSLKINPQNNLLYISEEANEIIHIVDPYTKKVEKNITNVGPMDDMAFDTVRDKIYGVDSDDDRITVINATTNKLISYIPVSNKPQSAEVNPTSGLLYVPNMDANTVTIINGTTNNYTTGIYYSVNSLESGTIECNGTEISGFKLYNANVDVNCKAIPRNGYVFSDWITNLPNSQDKEEIEFTASQYGNLTASFIKAPTDLNFTIPTQTLFQILIIIITAVVGVLIPRIADWINKLRQKKYLVKYANLINQSTKDSSKLQSLQKEIVEIYARGKISQSNYEVLTKRINELKQ